MKTTLNTHKQEFLELNIQDEVAAVALAAGLGTRLRPLTLNKPKPLVPFCGVEILQIVATKLKQVGIKDLGINAHYMPELVVDFSKKAFGSENNGDGVYVSVEREKILGTAGCYPNFRNFRKNRSLLTANGDVISNTNLEELYEYHKQGDFVATMAVLDKPHPKGAQIWVENGMVKHIGEDNGGHDKATPHGFACFQVLTDEVFGHIKEDEYQELVPIYKSLMGAGHRIGAFVHKAKWFDLGTHSDYLYAHFDVLNEIERANKEQRLDMFGIMESLKSQGTEYIFVPSNKHTNVGPNISISGPCLLVGTIKANEKVVLESNTVIMNDVTFTKPCTLSDTVVLPNTIVNKDHSFAILSEDHVIQL